MGLKMVMGFSGGAIGGLATGVDRGNIVLWWIVFIVYCDHDRMRER